MIGYTPSKRANIVWIGREISCTMTLVYNTEMSHHVLWIGRFRERRKMRLVPDSSDKITIRVVTSSRDQKTNRVTYETFDSIDVVDAKPEDVFATVKEAIIRAASAPK